VESESWWLGAWCILPALLTTKAELDHFICMGKVIVKVKLTSLKDLFLKDAGARRTRPRQVEIEALVDTGATRLYLKPSVIAKLGLQRVDAVRSRTTNGEAIRFKYEPVQLELMGRKENFDVIEVPESVPNLLGQVPLEVLDLVVDAKGQKLVPNPAHGGEQMTEEY
jgi:clan AA aspartic protease